MTKIYYQVRKRLVSMYQEDSSDNYQFIAAMPMTTSQKRKDVPAMLEMMVKVNNSDGSGQKKISPPISFYEIKVSKKPTLSLEPACHYPSLKKDFIQITNFFSTQPYKKKKRLYL